MDLSVGFKLKWGSDYLQGREERMNVVGFLENSLISFVEILITIFFQGLFILHKRI